MLRRSLLPLLLAAALPVTLQASTPDPADPSAPAAGAQQGRARGPAASPLDRFFEDAEAVEAGRAAVRRMLLACGAAARVESDGVVAEVDVWPSLPGLRYQSLETTYEYSGARDDRWRVHHRLPRLVHLAPDDRGYVLTEVVDAGAEGGSYRAAFHRAVVDGRVAWSEVQGVVADRGGDRNSKLLLAREQTLSTLPLCLPEVPADFALAREDEQAVVVRMRLARPTMFSSTEVLRHLTLYIDPRTGLPLQWQFQTEEMRAVDSEMNVIWTVRAMQAVELPEEVRADVERRLVEAWRAERVAAWRAAGNEGEPPTELTEARPDAEGLQVPERFQLPSLQIVATDPAARIKRFELVEPTVLPLPEGALERPWLTNELWISPVHADHWDPPAADDGSSEG